MNDILRIAVAEPVVHGVLKLVWDDGYEGIVDLRRIIEIGEIPENFKQVHLSRFGHSIYWGDEDDEDVDFGCDRLRELAEEQAALLARVG